MAIYRVQIGFWMDSLLPKHMCTINPHYVGDNPQALADQIKTNLKNDAALGTTLPFQIKVYDAQKPPPSYPLYTTTNGSDTIPSAMPREVALCLSYYSTWNRPQYRGRLYIPATFVGAGSGSTVRPTITQMNNCLRWKTLLSANLPAQHVWAIYSPKRDKADAVTHAWVDNEWDTVRSRGWTADNRVEASVP